MPPSAASVQAATARLLRGRSALIVTHRLQTVEDADRILVLADGLIREAGTHRELMAEGEGLYRLLAGCGPGQGADGAAGERRRGPGEGQAEQGGAHAEGRLASLAAWPEVFPGTPAAAFMAGGQANWGAFATPGAAAIAAGLPAGKCGAGGPAAPGAEAAGRVGQPPYGESRPLSRARPDPARRAASQGGSAPGRPASEAFGRLLSFAAPLWPWIALSALLGVATVGSGVALLGVSAWIIATAALRPSIAVLEVAIVGVRFFGITRGLPLPGATGLA